MNKIPLADDFDPKKRLLKAEDDKKELRFDEIISDLSHSLGSSATKEDVKMILDPGLVYLLAMLGNEI